MEKYTNVELPALLEVIETNLGINLDSIIGQATDIIGTERNNLNFLKGELKKQIGEYLKIVVKNIRQKILYQKFEDYIIEINEAII